MHNKTLMLALGVSLVAMLLQGCANFGAQGRSQAPPNIVVIMVDDMGWADLACYGNKVVDTPVLDRFAKQGMFFTDAYSASPVCSPTRAAMMTGMSPARVHLTNHAAGHPPGFAPKGAVLAEAPMVYNLELRGTPRSRSASSTRAMPLRTSANGTCLIPGTVPTSRSSQRSSTPSTRALR